jgi:hypothetical protein
MEIIPNHVTVALDEYHTQYVAKLDGHEVWQQMAFAYLAACLNCGAHHGSGGINSHQYVVLRDEVNSWA